MRKLHSALIPLVLMLTGLTGCLVGDPGAVQDREPMPDAAPIPVTLCPGEPGPKEEMARAYCTQLVECHYLALTPGSPMSTVEDCVAVLLETWTTRGEGRLECYIPLPM